MKPTYEELEREVLNLKRKVQAQAVARKELTARLSYEKMVSSVSTLAVMAEDDIGAFVDSCLKIMAERLDVSRIFIDAHHSESETLDTVYEWKADGYPSAKIYFRNIPDYYFKWVIDATRNNKAVTIDDIGALPDGPGKTILEAGEVKSFIAVPLFIMDTYYGYMGFSECREPRFWKKDDIDALITTSKIISQVFKNKYLESELKTAKQTAEAGTLAKSEFLANMSHEIRTPMNGIIAATDLLMGQQLTERSRHFLKLVHNSAHSLLGIINDILDFSKIEAGKLDIEKAPFRLDDVLERVCDVFASQAASKGIEIVIDIDPDIPNALVGDALRLQQVFTNLVSNALKFTKKGEIVIRGRIDSPGSGPSLNIDEIRLTFSVKDTGVGIAPGARRYLFKPFSQLDVTKTRNYSGTGLGLCISKQLVEMMGGIIWVDSRVGEGSTFTFTCLFRRQSVFEEPRVKLPSGLGLSHVLLVDDCEESRLVMEKALNGFGLRVTPISSGEEAVTMLSDETRGYGVDLIVLDWLMPGMDGIEVTRIIREELKLNLPIIMVTAFSEERVRRDAFRKGVNSFLVKPLSAETFYQVILDSFGKKNFGESPSQPAAATEIALYKNQLKGVPVLLVEDDFSNQEIIQAVLEEAGMVVTIASNGREAVDRVASGQPFDIALMDVQMPEMDGFKATREIRGLEGAASRIPIVAMTAHAMKRDEEKCLAAGMNAYIAKPITQERLFRTLWRCTRPKKMSSPLFPISGALGKEVLQKGSLPESLPGINIRQALTSLNLDAPVFRKILHKFLEVNRNNMPEIKTAFGAREWETLRFLSHNIKGSAGNIGAERLSGAARSMEEACKEAIGGGSVPREIFHQLETAFEEVKRSLESLELSPVTAENPLEPVTPIPGTAIELLKSLIDSLNYADPRLVADRFEAARPYLPFSLQRHLSNCLSNYDYGPAIEAVSALLTVRRRDE